MNGTTSVAPTRRGMFLTSNAVSVGRGGNGAAGGYLLITGRLMRIIAGLPNAFDISPDGCRVALSIADQTESTGFVRRLKMLDLCSKGA
jgi:hypothetical protein